MTRVLLPVLVLLVLLLSALSLMAGTVWLSPAAIARALTGNGVELTRLIVVEIRLPRLVLALLVGGILGLSGAVLQGLLRNPLAEPGLLGVSSGASLGAVIALYYGFSASFALATPLFALVGAMATIGVALGLSRTGDTLSLILAGVAVSTIASAGVSLALNLAPNPFAAYEIMTWLMGSLADRSWDHVLLAAPFILVGAVLLSLTAPALDALALGERQAESLGIHVRRTRLLALFGTALGVGAATAVAGAIGFVGLIAPASRPAIGAAPSGRDFGPRHLRGCRHRTGGGLRDTIGACRSGPEARRVHFRHRRTVLSVARPASPASHAMIAAGYEPLLRLVKVNAKRGGRIVIENASADFVAGRVTVVIGPNGAGKSTLLDLAAGLLTPADGIVAYGDTPLAAMARKELARRRAYLPQSPRVDWPISVERVVALGLTAHLPAFGGLARTWQPQIDAALDRFDLTSLRDRPATELSGGELARVMLARATVGGAETLIVDEPTVGLDPPPCARRRPTPARAGRRGDNRDRGAA